MNRWQKNRLSRSNVICGVGTLKQRLGSGYLSICEFCIP
jgi:hypothetical protein